MHVNAKHQERKNIFHVMAGLLDDNRENNIFHVMAGLLDDNRIDKEINMLMQESLR
jgi:hypothetical protein